jgi:alpha/beta superfamily hydrolase
MRQETVTFPSGDLLLSGRLHWPDGELPCPGVVVCHPHPLYGGTMDNPLVTGIAQILAQRDIAALRFDLRGVGRSDGSYDGGPGEADDGRAALSFLEAQPRLEADRLGIAGYSFGAAVALAIAAADHRVSAVAVVSPPTAAMEDWVCLAPAKSLLVICGEKDQVTDVEAIRALLGRLPNRPSTHFLPWDDHFWWGNEGQVGRLVAAYFAELFRVEPDQWDSPG